MGAENRSAIAVLGAGAWGAALAILLARNGHPTWLWAHNEARVRDMAVHRRNGRFPDVALPDELEVSGDIEQVLARTDDILVVVPSHAFRETLERIEPFVSPRRVLLWATKGLEVDTGKLLHQVVDEVLDDRVIPAVLSGPSFAGEVVANLPTAVTVACRDEQVAARLASRFHNDSFRVYTSSDILGVELGGALKNVFAIAAGIADGLGFGANARAALITRGIAEMVRLGLALGGRRETFMGLAGVGDLVLTCTDDQSRNRRLGLAIGRGESLEAAKTAIGQVVEGVQTACEMQRVAEREGIEMPITEQVYQVLYCGRSPRQAVQELLQREQKAEFIG